MTTYYLYISVDVPGKTFQGNMSINVEGVLNLEALQNAKRAYCDSLLKNGVVSESIKTDDAIIKFICPL